MIDIVPQPFKEFAIATFGEYDKIALLVGLGLAVLIASAIAGILELVRPPLGAVALGVAGILSVAAVVTRAGATAVSWIPSVAGAIAGAALLIVLGRMLRAWRSDATRASGTASDAADSPASGVARRRFLLISGIAAAGAVVVGIGSRVAGATTSSIAALRRGLNLPAPRTTVTVPAGAELDIEGISPLYTPNADFYRVDTALTVPTIDPETWRLSVVGMVDTPLELTFDDLVGMGLDEYSVTLTCVSNEVGGDLVGTAKWWGVPIRDVLRAAGPAAEGHHVRRGRGLLDPARVQRRSADQDVIPHRYPASGQPRRRGTRSHRGCRMGPNRRHRTGRGIDRRR